MKTDTELDYMSAEDVKDAVGDLLAVVRGREAEEWQQARTAVALILQLTRLGQRKSENTQELESWVIDWMRRRRVDKLVGKRLDGETITATIRASGRSLYIL